MNKIPDLNQPAIPTLQDPVPMQKAAFQMPPLKPQGTDQEYPAMIKKALGKMTPESTTMLSSVSKTPVETKKLSETKYKDIQGKTRYEGLSGDLKGYIGDMLGQGKEASSVKGGENVVSFLNSYLGDNAHKKFFEMSKKMSTNQAEKLADFLEALGKTEDENIIEGKKSGEKALNAKLDKSISSFKF